jgi:hypothetical protein
MPTSRVTALLAALILLGPLHAEGKKPDVTEATFKQLWDAPEKYNGKLVRIEGVVESARERPRLKDNDNARYSLTLKGGLALYIFCDGKPTVAKGGRVRVTGLFTYKRNSFVRRVLAVQGPHGKVEKLPATK